ncbi:MAG: hypothetical protein H0W83_12065 [Planctomycetes bacterium]|nr:hypothetical protein [Planctomycetota bacterium]
MLAGDLNSKAGSPWIARIESRFLDTWSEGGGDPKGPLTGLNGTWHADWIMRSRADDSLRAIRAWTIPTGLSENHPILAEMDCAK